MANFRVLNSLEMVERGHERGFPDRRRLSRLKLVTVYSSFIPVMFHQKEDRFRNRRGQSLYVCILRPERMAESSSSSSAKKPTDILFFHHGLTDYSKRHLPPACGLASKIGPETVVVAYDCHGHGYSEGTRSYVLDFNHLVDDLLDFIQTYLPTQFPNSTLRIFAMGHSMGGATIAIAASRQPQLFEAILLSSPVVQLLPRTIGSTVQKLALRFLSLFIGRYRAIKRKSVRLGTRDEKAAQALEEDKVWDRLPHRLGMISSLFQGCDIMQSEVVESFGNGKAAQLPLYIQQGTCDAATHHDYCLEFVASIVSKCGSRSRVTLNLFDGAYHDLDFDPETPNCQEMMSKWVKSLSK
jgi:alpha-beta hydrolase superfamily lysophospholipase